MITIALFALAAYLLGLVSAPAYEYFREWRSSRRKFTCDVCKMRRAAAGSSPLALDLDYGNELVPLNIRVCKVCVPPGASGGVF